VQLRAAEKPNARRARFRALRLRFGCASLRPLTAAPMKPLPPFYRKQIYTVMRSLRSCRTGRALFRSQPAAGQTAPVTFVAGRSCYRLHPPQSAPKTGVMKLLVDECLSEELTKLGKQRGHAEASHIAWIGKRGWKDWELKAVIVDGDWAFFTRNSVDFRGPLDGM
jgi:hypothetical protein